MRFVKAFDTIPFDYLTKAYGVLKENQRAGSIPWQAGSAQVLLEAIVVRACEIEPELPDSWVRKLLESLPTR